MSDLLSAASAGTVSLGDALEVSRLGIGTNRTTGSDTSQAVLRRAIELGIQLIDTADVYTRTESESSIAATLHPYPLDVAIATKGGIVEGGADTSYDYLSVALERSRERLRTEAVDLYYVHRLDGTTPIAETARFLEDALEAGTIRAAGLSNVSVEQIEAFRQVVPIAAVQNQYSVLQREHEPVLEYCEANGIVFVPYQPLKAGATDEHLATLAEVGARYGLETPQVAIAWLLQRSPVIAPIPGTQSIAHLEANVQAASVTLNDDDLAILNGLAPA
jgi:pyridoxine 4-dehydrogenase